MKKKEITIYDIANKLGLAASTVSRALKGHLVSKKTQKKIIAAAEEMGYRSNTFASNLRMQRTNTIGIIVPRLNSYFMSEVIAGVEKVTSEAGYNLIISQSMENADKEQRNVKTMFDNRVDGLLVSLAIGSNSLTDFGSFIERNIPVLFFDRVPDQAHLPSITIDNEQSAYMVTRHLIEMGAKNIIHVTGAASVTVYRDRAIGYKKAMDEAGLVSTTDQIINSELNEKAGIEVAAIIIEKGADGVFVANDNCAASCMNELKRRGMRIPEDLLFAGFNNDMISRNVDPPLTTVDYPGFEMGKLAAAKILDHLSGKLDMNSSPLITMKSELVVRQSSRRNLA